MGVGHLAVGFAAKRWAPRTSLAWLVLAPIFVDLLWGLFILAGVEHARITPGITKVMPLELYDIRYTHSLVGTLVWSALLAAIYFALHKNCQENWQTAAVLFAGVFSHWVLDFVSHRPDMPIGLHGPYVGLGLWNHPAAALLVEMAMLAIGVWLYVAATRPKGSQLGLAIAIMVMFAFNLAAYLGPPPPSITAPAVANLLLVPVLWILHRIDRRRQPA